jgi:hypothetical protein
MSTKRKKDVGSETSGASEFSIVIEKEIPLPTPRMKYPFEQIDIGDSFEFPIVKRSCISQAAKKASSIFGMKFTIRKITQDKGRIWRTQ